MFRKIAIVLSLLVGVSYADVARTLHSGELLGCIRESRRKVAWIAENSVNNDYTYIEPGKTMKFITAFVRVKGGFSIGIDDYELADSNRARYKAKSVVLASSNFSAAQKKFINSGKTPQDVKLLFEIPEKEYLVDLVWNLQTTVPMNDIQQISVLENGRSMSAAGFTDDDVKDVVIFVSSEHENNRRYNLLDKNADTFWTSLESSAVVDFSLPSSKKLSGCEINWAGRQHANSNVEVYGFDVEKGNWEKLGAQKLNTDKVEVIFTPQLETKALRFIFNASTIKVREIVFK